MCERQKERRARRIRGSENALQGGGVGRQENSEKKEKRAQINA